MSISLIWCMGSNRVIGLNNKMPWHLPAELAYFRRTTKGHTVLMGRKTFESIGKPLPYRKNVILTTNTTYHPDDTEVVHSIDQALETYGDSELFIVGGSEVYTQFLPYADKLHVTIIDHEFAGDTYFPEFDLDEWKLVSREDGITDENNPYRYAFYVYEKIR